MPDGENIGVVYCDITGLKNINDTKGHKAGDELIVRACESLKRVFVGAGLFRVGGDELLALYSQIEDETLAKKVEMLRADLCEHDVVMAIGADCRKDGRANIDRLLSTAEKRMYEDKAAYYKKIGVDRRK